MTAPTTNRVIAFLESVQYEYLHELKRGPSIVALKDDAFVDTSGQPFGEYPEHDRICAGSVSLCSGDGYRWTPGTPTLP